MLICKILLPFAGLPGTEGRRTARVDGRFKGVKNQLPGRVKRDAGEEVIHDADQCRGAVVDQVFEMDCQHFGTIQPVQVGREACGDIWEFDIRVGSSENAGVEAGIEIGQREIILVVNVMLFNPADIKDVRYDHVARIAKDEIGDKFR